MNKEVESRQEEKKPAIKIEYRHLDPDEALLIVDSEKLATVFQEQGLKIRRLVMVDHHSDRRFLGAFNQFNNTVYLYNHNLIEAAKTKVNEVLLIMGEEPLDIPPVTFWDDLRKLNPATWPHYLTNRQIPFWIGDQERRLDYLNRARLGELQPETLLSSQRNRARSFMERLLPNTIKRYAAAILAHECEHDKDKGKKSFIEISSVGLPLIIGDSLITWISLDLTKKGINPDKDIRFWEAAIVTQLVSSCGLLFERAIHESTSYSASRDDWKIFF